MQLKKEVVRTLLMLSIAASATLSVVGCSERKPTPPAAPAPAPSTAAPSSSSAPPVPPGSATDVTKKGTETGMIGGESGTVASSGKPGTGTESGAGTGAAQSSDSKTENKK